MLENILESLGYEEREVMKLLSTKYQNFATPLTISNISNLGEFSIDLAQNQETGVIVQSSWKKKFWDKYFTSQILIPDVVHRRIIKTMYRILFKINSDHRWNTKWK